MTNSPDPLPQPLIPDQLSREAVRAALLVAQGVERRDRKKAAKPDVLAAIRTMGQLQIDTISVVARSPYFVLWSRLGAYNPDWLDELLAENAIFEAWSHEACFMPAEAFPLSRARIRQPHAWRKRFIEYLAENRAAADTVLDHIRANGSVRSADFKNDRGPSSGWWDWKKEKRLLESLFASGEILVARRDSFQRVYDLPERVVPDWDPSRTPSYATLIRAHVLKSVRALGVATAPWATDYYRFRAAEVSSELSSLAETGELLETSIEGVKGRAYVHPANASLVNATDAGVFLPERTTMLSPFDPVVWDRRRGEELFDFHYRIECYTPAEKRLYGYFSLPILHRGSLVGRLDAKAHRKDGVFEVKSLHLEPGVEPDQELAESLATALIECAVWHNTPKVVIRRSKPRGFAPQVRGFVKQTQKRTGSSPVRP